MSEWHQEARRLRKKDPKTWTYERLAFAFGVARLQIWRVLNPKRALAIRNGWRKRNMQHVRDYQNAYYNGTKEKRAKRQERARLLWSVRQEAKATGKPREEILAAWSL